MKIINIKAAFLLPVIFAGIAFTGCSNEDIAEEKVQEGMGAVSFTISEKDYEPAEEVASTRAAVQAKPEIQDLGDGLQAEVSLEPDTTHDVEPKAKTRAIYKPTHYTIQAYQGSVKKGELKGTFNGSTFTPDAGQSNFIILPHGTYDFVCFNDKVSVNGTQFTVNRTDAATARFTIERNVVINQDPKQYVAFKMKHAGARIIPSIQFINCPIIGEYSSVGTGGFLTYASYRAVNPAERLKYIVETSPNKIPEKEVYDFAANGYTYPAMGQLSISKTVEGIQTVSQHLPVGTKTGIYSDFITDYLLPSSDCANLKFTFTFGELYGRSLVGKTITVPTHKLVEANKSYRVVVKLIMGSNMYLFKDGTVGELAKNPTKIPIGVVIEPYRRIAVALNDADNGTPTIWSSLISQESSQPATNYKELFGEFGIEASTRSDYSMPSALSARKLALDYYQTVGYGNNYYSFSTDGDRASNAWFVPTLDDFLRMGISLGKLPNETSGRVTDSSIYSKFDYLVPSNAPATGFTGSNPSFPPMDMTRFNKAFTDAGGTAPSGNYWADTECKDASLYPQVQQVQMILQSTGYSLGINSKSSYAKVRPFIRY